MYPYMQYEIVKCKKKKMHINNCKGDCELIWIAVYAYIGSLESHFFAFLTFWSCSYHLQLLKILISKSLQHCGKGQHTKKSMYTFLLIESHTYYEISD
jgi:hypothetical protein